MGREADVLARPPAYWGAALFIAWHLAAVGQILRSDGYADPAACAACHAAIASSYSQTGMARSFRRFTSDAVVEDFGGARTFEHPASASSFEMLRRGGVYYQRRSQTGYQKAETNVEEKKIDYVIGSGNHARTYLHLTSRNILQQLPLGWYAENGGHWGMSPGYDRPDHLFSRRRVSYECMACHNAYPRIPTDSRAYGSDPVFVIPLPEGIDCQRCHGPGAQHVAIAKMPGSSSASIRKAIVNPARLDTTRQMEVCLQCHLETTSSPLPHAIARYDHPPFSYSPDQPLGDFIIFFEAAKTDRNRFEIADTAGRLRRSACFIRSAGALQCTTCHNPHRALRGKEAAAAYVEACLRCHSKTLQHLIAGGRHTEGANCLDCHMPKRRTDDAVHVVMTDHFIQRRPPSHDPLASVAEQELLREDTCPVVPYYPDPLPDRAENHLYKALAQIRDRSNLKAGVAQLSELIRRYQPSRPEFWFELANGKLALGQRQEAIALYREAARRAPESLPVMKGLASAIESESALRSAIGKWRDDSDLRAMLGQLLLKRGRAAEAAAVFNDALSREPELPEAWNSLGIIMARSDPAKAEHAFLEAVRIDPGMAAAYANLGALLEDRDVEQAKYYYARSLTLEPNPATNLGENHLRYALLLARTGQSADAEFQAALAVKCDPTVAEAHELLGNLKAQRNDGEAAIAEFESAVKLKPNFAVVHFELAVELSKKGDKAAALSHLREAARSTDPAIRNKASRGLAALGR